MSNRTWPHMENPNREHTHSTLYTNVEKLNNYALALGFIMSSIHSPMYAVFIYSNFDRHLEPVSIKVKRSESIASTIDQAGVERTSIMRNLKEINVVQEITFRSSIFRLFNQKNKKKKIQETAITFSGIGARKIYNCDHVWSA